MTMQIKTISLYGKNGQRRDVDFELGCVNIITGASKRGKTSLIDIVEYCLGASECTVKEGRIRQTVDWYAILLQLTDCQLFIARAAPIPGSKANSASHMIISKEISIPEKSEIKNTTMIDEIRLFLTSKIGVPEHRTEVPEGQTRSEFKISFKHSLYYLFQSQNEIANNDVLFHHQAKQWIPQIIKDTLPYFIGAAEDDRLTEIENLRALKRKRNRLIKQLREIESLKGDGLQKGYTLLTEASELGLTKKIDIALSDEALIDELNLVAIWKPNEICLDEENDNLVILEREYQYLLNKKNALKYRLREANEYGISQSGFEKAVNEQVYRLNSVKLLKPAKKKPQECSVCESKYEGRSKFEEIINKSLLELDYKLKGINKSRPRINSYISELEKEQTQLLNSIRKVKASINKIRENDDELDRQVDLDILRAKIVGKIALYIESINWNKDVNGLENQINILNEDIRVLSDLLDPEALKEKLNAQLSYIAEDMTSWARELKLEHSSYRIKLDPNKLTVVAETPHGIIPLSNMGSGENWVGYHLVTYFALAKWFIEQSRPVGNFLFIDQPSQVYFPAEESITGKLSEIVKDEDREAVKSMFLWIFDKVQFLNPKFQVIITDHADIDEEWFQNAIRDKKWRGEYALIPKDWYEKNEISKTNDKNNGPCK